MKLVKTLKVQNELGEGVQWHHASNSLWWTDIQKSILYQYSFNTEQITKHEMPERVACFAFTKESNKLVVAFASGIAFYFLSTKKITWLKTVYPVESGKRLNDGRVDRAGNFWVGGLVEDEHQITDKASLYCFDKQQTLTTVLTNIDISNSLCFSLNGETLYHTDTPSQQIKQYQLDQTTNTLTASDIFAQTENQCFPDGACIDANGYLWNAQWGGSQVVRYDRQGNVDKKVPLPVPQPSCVAIGGPEMNLLFITTARQDLNAHQLAKFPQSGDLFIYQLDEALGVAENIYFG